MSYRDYTAANFEEVMAGRPAPSPRPSGGGRAHREPSSFRRSGDAGSRHPQAGIQGHRPQTGIQGRHPQANIPEMTELQEA